MVAEGLLGRRAMHAARAYWALVTLLWLFGSSTDAVAQQAALRMTWNIDSSSDWTRIEVRGLTWKVERKRLETLGSGEVQAPLQGNVLWIKKSPLNLAAAQLELQVSAVATGEPIQVLVTRGDLGRTKLTWRVGKTVVGTDESSGRTGAVGNLRVMTPDFGRLDASAALPRRDWGRRVLAFYYGWWGTPTGPARSWEHWDPQADHRGVLNQPTLGMYDSADPKVIAQHVTWARQAGIQTLVMSLWRRGAHQDLVLKRLLDEAAAQGLTATGYIEVAATPDDLRQQLESLLANEARHPAWLTVHGQKVVFLYVRVFQSLNPDALRKALRELPVLAIGDSLDPNLLEVLGGLHSYVSFLDPAKRAEQIIQARQAARAWDKLLVATVMPGYDDTTIRFPGRHIPRDGTRYWQAQTAAVALADWVVLTSFNELHEGSEIEPTSGDGPAWLLHMRQFVDSWTGARP